jgi:nucleotide-diphospho-sugar transferase
MVIICGSKQLEMLNVCLKSIYKNFEKLPHIFLFTDNDLNIIQCKNKISWYPDNCLTIMSSEGCINYHHGNKSLVSFAKKNVMGLKLAAILQVLDKGKPVMYCDTDVIWYEDPFQAIGKFIENSAFEIGMSEDFQPAYDVQLIEKAALEALYKPPYFCAGILLLKKLSQQGLASLERLLKVVEHQSNHFSEQTIFAFLNREGGDVLLDGNKFLLKIDDQFTIRPKPIPGVIARHYTGAIRHLFWRDALWLK